MKTTPLALAGFCLLYSILPTTGHTQSPPDLLMRIQEHTNSISQDLIEIRRQIHMHPELSGMEEKTAALIVECLASLDLEVQSGVGGHGVVAILRGGQPGPVVAYRADMDAVPSMVLGDQPYRSQIDGVKHVCGHDAHVAIGIGVARVLSQVRAELPGTVKFIFQPAEENGTGAAAMIKDGVLEEDPRPQAIFGLHTVPYPVGSIACLPGVGLSGILPFGVTLQTDSGLEELTQNVVQAIHEVSTVSMIASGEDFEKLMHEMTLEDGPLESFIFVAAVTKKETDEGTAVEGWLRASGPPMYAEAKTQIEAAVERLAKEATYDIEFRDLVMPDMHSDPELTHAAIPSIQAALGDDSIIMLYASAPYFGEDFAFFQEHIPGAMFFLGTANPEKGITAYNHFPDYDIDESAITIGTIAMSMVLVNYLAKN